MRRFEWIQGNEAKFWEIAHYDDTVVTRAGKIGGKPPPEKEKECMDDMAAEVEFDKQIHAKRRAGYVEVETPSDPPAPFEERPVELRPLDGSTPEHFSGKAMQYLLWRFVEVLLLDRHRPADDLSRWHYRAARHVDLEESPSPGDPTYDAWRERFIELSAKDRAAPMRDDLIGAFKFREGTHWIVTPEECVIFARESSSRLLKRRKDTEEHTAWLASWTAFHERVKDVGYEVVPTARS